MMPPNTGTPMNRMTRLSMRSVTTSGTAAVLPYSTVLPPLPLPYASEPALLSAAGEEGAAGLPAACCCRWRSCSSYAAWSACSQQKNRAIQRGRMTFRLGGEIRCGRQQVVVHGMACLMQHGAAAAAGRWMVRLRNQPHPSAAA